MAQHQQRPGESYDEQVAADFEAANPGVTIQIEAMAHDDMLTQLSAAFQSGDVPDVFMERGGGELVDNVEAGWLKDLTELAADEIELLGGAVSSWQHEDKTYALPFSLGVVGFWYNTDLFEQAGITDTPETFDEFFAVIDDLKAAGITPISVGAGDGWPAGHYWYYTALRACSEEVLNDAVAELDFSDDCFVAAGEHLQAIIDAEPFNRGFLQTSAQEGPTSASGLLATGQVAMELAGHWEPGVMEGILSGEDDTDGTIEGNLAWFPFPAVPDGAGDPAAQLGGGDAWAVRYDAPDIAVEFVQYLLSDEVQRGFAELDMGLPTNPNTTDAVSDQALAELLDIRDDAPYVQLYLDTAFGEAVGGAMNDAIALIFSGSGEPSVVVEELQSAADLHRQSSD